MTPNTAALVVAVLAVATPAVSADSGVRRVVGVDRGAGPAVIVLRLVVFIRLCFVRVVHPAGIALAPHRRRVGGDGGGAVVGGGSGRVPVVALPPARHRELVSGGSVVALGSCGRATWRDGAVGGSRHQGGGVDRGGSAASAVLLPRVVLWRRLEVRIRKRAYVQRYTNFRNLKAVSIF